MAETYDSRNSNGFRLASGNMKWLSPSRLCSLLLHLAIAGFVLKNVLLPQWLDARGAAAHS